MINHILFYIIWDVDKTLVSIGSWHLRWYSFGFFLSFACGIVIMNKILHKEHIHSENFVTDLVLNVGLGTIIGARLAHCFFYDWSYYSAHPLEILQVWKGGLASHGGFIGVIIAIYYTSRKYKQILPKQSFLWLFDRVCLVLPLAAGFIRLGNLMNSEIIGKYSTLPWSFIFLKAYPPSSIPRHPAQLYEAIAYLSSFFIVNAYYRRNVTKLQNGKITSLVMIMLSIFRFSIEFFKENQSAFENGMLINMGQLLTLPFLACGVLLFIKQRHTKQINYLQLTKH